MERSKAEATVAKHRDRFRDRQYLPITLQQRGTQKDPGDVGIPLWTSRVLMSPPEDDDVLHSLSRTIIRLGDGVEDFHRPTINAVEGEWVGYRYSSVEDIKVSTDTERSKFEKLMGDVTTHGLTMLFVHGGVFYMGSPAASRPIAARLVKNTGARAFSLRYRLAPQNPFPAALLDLLVAYLSLLYPPAGAHHEPIAASSIVLTGESAGGNLCVALVQFILELGRQQSRSVPRIKFHGKEVPVLLPAGVSSVCGWMDETRALPSANLKTVHDVYEPGPPTWLHSNFPACPLWPSTPPRGELYCDLSIICHPLVSPTTTKDWTTGPPMFICCGEERAADANIIIAKQAKSQGVRVLFEQFEAMPHLFMQLLGNTPHVERCYSGWADFCKLCVEHPQKLRSKETLVEVETLNERPIDLDSFSLSYNSALALMNAAKDAGRVWHGPTKSKSML